MISKGQAWEHLKINGYRFSRSLYCFLSPRARKTLIARAISDGFCLYWDEYDVCTLRRAADNEKDAK